MMMKKKFLGLVAQKLGFQERCTQALRTTANTVNL
jgi:hypothetical protein